MYCLRHHSHLMMRKVASSRRFEKNKTQKSTCWCLPWNSECDPSSEALHWRHWRICAHPIQWNIARKHRRNALVDIALNKLSYPTCFMCEWGFIVVQNFNRQSSKTNQLVNLKEKWNQWHGGSPLNPVTAFGPYGSVWACSKTMQALLSVMSKYFLTQEIISIIQHWSMKPTMIWNSIQQTQLALKIAPEEPSWLELSNKNSRLSLSCRCPQWLDKHCMGTLKCAEVSTINEDRRDRWVHYAAQSDVS